MSRFDTARNLLHAAVLYWGPAGVGKTAALAKLREALDPEQRSRLYSVAGEDGSTLAFDLLPIEEFRFGSVRVRLRVLAGPGRVNRSHARHTLLKEADAVVFVADARRSESEANSESWHELLGALRGLGKDPASIPLVCAVNRGDDPDAAPAPEVAGWLGRRDLPSHQMNALEGTGVLEPFREAFHLALAELAARHDVADADQATAYPADLLPQLKRTGARPPRAAEDRHLVVRAEGPEISAAEQALRTQLGLVQAHVEADVANRRLEDRNRELVAVNRVARSLLSAMEIDNLLVVLIDSAADYLDATHVSCVLFDPTEDGALRTHVRGFGRDPALSLKEENARRFFALLRDSDGPVPFQPEYNPELLESVRRVDNRIKRAMFQPIKGDHDKPAGWIGVYHTGDEPRVNTQGLLFLSSISRLAALGIGKIALLEKMQRTHARLVAQLRDRTGKLEMANARVRALNRGLESRVKERVRALEESNRRLKEDRAGAVQAARLHGIGEVATSFVHEVQGPAATLGEDLETLRDSLDELRVQVASSAPGPDAVAALDQFETVLARSEDGVRRIAHVVRSLQRFAAGGDAGPAEVFNVNTLVADAVALLEERIAATAELELSLGTLPDQEGSGTELAHVVLGLLTNAVEAIERTGRRGRIHVTSFASGDRLTLLVKDDGCGIEEALLGRIFEPFVSTKSGEPGAGLGLHGAYKVVRARGGDIRVRSRAGEGTTVKVVLPAAPRRAPAPGAAAAQP